MKRIEKLLAVCLVAALAESAIVGCDKNGSEQPKVDKKAAEKKVTAKKTPAEKPRIEKPKAPEAAPTETAETPAEPKAQVIVEDIEPTGSGILDPSPLDSLLPEVPPVVMSEKHAATCLVKVGDVLPEARLPDLGGTEQDLAKLLGDKLTIVFFWTSTNRHSVDELHDMAVKVASPLAPLGVRVVGINERDTADAARKACEQAGVSFPVLLDADGKFYESVATASIPRTYLLDATGKIVWFDIEYSGATRHDLREALRALLPKQE
jgi:peroxiredoxin